MTSLTKKSYTIAIDFDGTIVEDTYPEIGKPRMFAFDTMKQLQKSGHRLILWTYREGKALENAVLFCKKKGIDFYAINKSHPEELAPYKTRKISADLFIDDRNIQGVPDWGVIGQQLLKSTKIEIKQKSLLQRIFK